jgi:ribosomal protein L37AE/L43A
MKEVRKCKYCGKDFVPRSGMQKYCCEECQTKAKEARKKRQQDFMNAVEPVIDLQCQELPVLIVSVIWGINELMVWMNGK